MQQMLTLLDNADEWTADGIKTVIDPWAEQTGIKPWTARRVALVGTGQRPDMYELAAFLGKEEVVKRMNNAIEALR